MWYKSIVLALFICIGVHTSNAQSPGIEGMWTYKSFVGIEVVDAHTRSKLEFIYKKIRLELNADGTYVAYGFNDITKGEYKASKKKIVFKDVAGKVERPIVALTEEEFVFQFNDDGLVIILKRGS